MTQVATAEIVVFENAETLARNAATWLCDLAQASERTFAVCLSGGSTPQRLYELLGEAAYGLSDWFGSRARQIPNWMMNSVGRWTPCSVQSIWWRSFAAARAQGAGPTRILLRHVLPNVAAPIFVSAALGIDWGVDPGQAKLSDKDRRHPRVAELPLVFD